MIWTKLRAEKAVARALESKQIVHWLPTYLQKRKWSDRWKEVEFPLFPGGLANPAPDAGWSTLLHVPGVPTIVKQGKVPAPISQLEIDNLKAAIHRVLEMGEEPEVEK